MITGCVVPRPIALITTLGPDGEVNAAPFSFFNALGSAPPIVAFGPGIHSLTPLRPKDTRRNVSLHKEFVVNMVTEELVEAMTIASATFPDGESEIEFMGVTLGKSRQVKPPRIVESPVNLECKLMQELDFGFNKVFVGEVVEMHIQDDLINQEKMYINYDKLNFLGRMPGGSGIYSRTTDLLIVPRISYEDIKAGKRISDLPTTIVAEEVEVTQRLSAQFDAMAAAQRSGLA